MSDTAKSPKGQRSGWNDFWFVDKSDGSSIRGQRSERSRKVLDASGFLYSLYLVTNPCRHGSHNSCVRPLPFDPGNSITSADMNIYLKNLLLIMQAKRFALLQVTNARNMIDGNCWALPPPVPSTKEVSTAGDVWVILPTHSSNTCLDIFRHWLKRTWFSILILGNSICVRRLKSSTITTNIPLNDRRHNGKSSNYVCTLFRKGLPRKEGASLEQLRTMSMNG